MAYNKRNWKARQGTGLNFFSIDGATPVPIVNQPTTLTEEGDALSAGNLNDLEQRIADAFDDVEESKADKSTTDALQSQINQHDSRLQNLEQKAGDYGTWHYPNDPDHSSDMPNKVPTGKAKYGLVKTIVGKTRAWNQPVQNGNFSDGSTGWSITNGTISVSGGIATLTATDTLVTIERTAPIVSGRMALVCFRVEAISGTVTHRVRNPYTSPSFYSTSKGDYFYIGTAGNSGQISLQFSCAVGDTIQLSLIYMRDLTLILDDWNPSDITTANIPLMVQQIPDILKHDDLFADGGNGYSLVDTTIEGVEATGVNLFDGEYEVGGIDATTGENFPSDNRWRSKKFCRCPSNTDIYVKSTFNLRVFWYDANKNKISYSTLKNRYTTSPVNAVFFRFSNTESGETYIENDIQLCLNSYSDKTTFHPFQRSTLMLSSPVTMRSDDELTPETGAIVRKMVKLDLSDYDWTYSNPYWNMTAGTKKTNFINMVKAFGAYAIPNWISADLEVATGVDVVTGSKTYAIGQSSDNSMLVNNGSGTTPPSGSLVVELATPTTESIDPIPDNTILTEGGGTIDTIQTQTPVIDNCLDVGYLAV